MKLTPQNFFDCFALPLTLWVQPWDNKGIFKKLNKSEFSRLMVVVWLLTGLTLLEGFKGSLLAALLAKGYEKQANQLKGR